MNRAALVWDRVVTIVVGFVGLVVGLAAIAWVTGIFGRFRSGVPDRVDLHRGYGAALGTGWWPWVAGGGGVVLVVLGLWWLLAHITVNAVRHLELTGSGATGSLQAASSGVAKAAGQVFAACPGVRSASSSIRTDRGQLVLELAAVADPDVDLGLVAAAAVRTAGQVADVTGLDTLTARGKLTVAARSRS